MNELPAVPASLRSAVEADLRPVQPLPPPSRRLAALAPVALALLAVSVALFGLRGDAPRLGFELTWGASFVQMCVGLAVMAAALREAVPGTLLARRTVVVVIATAGAVIVAITWTTWWSSPTMIRPGSVLFVWQVCVAGTFLTALPALALAAWLVARAWPLRPRVAGALYGLGAGLLSDAGWRLFCHFSDPVHVLAAHTVAVALTTIAGAVLAIVITRKR